MQYGVAEECMQSIPTQSATTQTVSLIYDPHNIMLKDRELISENSYPIQESIVYDAPPTDRIEILRKSTLV